MFSDDPLIELTFNYFTFIIIILDILMNSYTDTSSNLLQVLSSIHLLFIVDLCVSYLLDHHALIMKLVLGCDSKLSVGRIPNQTYGFSSLTGLWEVVARVPVF